MTRLIQLSPEVEEIAAAQAQKNGLSLEEYLPNLIADALQHTPPTSNFKHRGLEAESRAARIQRFRQWAESNGHDMPLLSDEQIGREALYAPDTEE